MRRLTKCTLFSLLTLLVLFALLLTALRFFTPKLHNYHTEIEQEISQYTGSQVQIGRIVSQWSSFGPVFQLENIHFITEAKIEGRVDRMTFELDIWRTLLHLRLQLKDVTFQGLTVDIPASQSQQPDKIRQSISASALSKLLLKQFQLFEIRDSKVSFISPSGRQVTVDIPSLTWLNQRGRHRAEGQISVSDVDGQYGSLQIRADLRDKNEYLNDGVIYLQADDVNMRPWFNRWLRKNTGLISANFSLASWLHIKNGILDSSLLLLKEGDIRWRENSQRHDLNFYQQSLKFYREKDGWVVDLPKLNIAIDGVEWQNGRISSKWMFDDPSLPDLERATELRIRANDLSLNQITPLIPVFSPISPDILAIWNKLQPHGQLTKLDLDIPLKKPEDTRFDMQWRDISWQQLQPYPGINHFSGTAQGSLQQGRLRLDLAKSEIPFGNMFRAPLEIKQADVELNWLHKPDSFNLWSNHVDIQAKDLWLNGSFDYRHDPQQPPWLSILAGIRLDDAKQAWRYFPEPLMGSDTANYLTAALQGGKVDNASLIYAGDPSQFPYPKKEGLFEVYVPLREATFQYQPDWPALKQLAINLDFVNDGLWMHAEHTLLGEVDGNNIQASIPHYGNNLLHITAGVSGQGQAVHDYFTHTPLNDSIAIALDHVQIKGNVDGSLDLMIPLNGGQVTAKGDIKLAHNDLYIAALDSSLTDISGSFSFHNGELISRSLQGQWFNQPVRLQFSTEEKPDNYSVNVKLDGDWQANKLSWFPTDISSKLAGSADWQAKVNIQLPSHHPANYQVELATDLQRISSELPSPLNKKTGIDWPVKIEVAGGLNGFNLQAKLNNHRLNSDFSFIGDNVELSRLNFRLNSKQIPPLTKEKLIVAQLPSIKLDDWLDYLSPVSKPAAQNNHHFSVTPNAQIAIAGLHFLGQNWGALSLRQKNNHYLLKGQDIDATIKPGSKTNPWNFDINYLYANPELAQSNSSKPISYKDWPSFDLTCHECWLFGQRFNHISGQVRANGGVVKLSQGVIDSGVAKLTVNGTLKTNRNHFTGELSGASFHQANQFFGIETPIEDAPFDVKFDLNWGGSPWPVQRTSLNGSLAGHLGKGSIDNLGGGRAGQLLRFVSFDALLRKLQFDFSDIFGSGFYFNSLQSTSKIDQGILRLESLYIDGLAADVNMQGKIDLINEQLDLNVDVAPEVSAGVGVAAAFAVNPVAGAIAYVGSKVFNPIWGKIFKISYTITGPFSEPVINEKAIEHRSDNQPRQEYNRRDKVSEK